VLDLVRPNLGKAVRLEADLAAAEPVLADPALIGQVVLNLCLNARDAMPAGGTLTVGTAVVTLSPAEAAAHPHGRPGRHVRISVADTGTGMPAEVLARVFEPFFTTKGVGKGTGLGLAMVDGIVRQHGGWVAVASTLGAGTRFDIYLTPAGQPATGSNAAPWTLAERVPPDLTDTPAPAPPPAGGAYGTVLLVDDEEMIRVLGRSVLEDAGYRVLEASDGAEAVDLFRERHAGIDLVVLDLTMPRMSGQEACRRMAEIRADARVLLSSGYSADDLPDVAGAVGLLAKPYRPAELTAAVRRALGRTVSTG
jgi:CheY-like chemotaxis protein